MADPANVDLKQENTENQETKPEESFEYSFIEQGGKLLYKSTQEEFDDCFYQIIALGSFAKTFKIGNRLELTFMTISQQERTEMYAEVQAWGKDQNVSKAEFESEMKKRSLSHYLTSVSIDGNVMNLRGGSIEERMQMLSQMTEQTIDYYSLYQWVFHELVTRALMSKSAVKN